MVNNNQNERRESMTSETVDGPFRYIQWPENQFKPLLRDAISANWWNPAVRAAVALYLASLELGESTIIPLRLICKHVGVYFLNSAQVSRLTLHRY